MNFTDPNKDQIVPPPHHRTLPRVPINEQGMRELELWLEEKLKRFAKNQCAVLMNFLNGNDQTSWNSALRAPLAKCRGYFFVESTALNPYTNNGIDIADKNGTSSQLNIQTEGQLDLSGDRLSGSFEGDISIDSATGNIEMVSDGTGVTADFGAEATSVGVNGTGTTTEIRGKTITIGQIQVTTVETHLEAAGTFTIRDSADNPIVQYTG